MNNGWNNDKVEWMLLILGVVLFVFVAVNYAWLLIKVYA